MRIGRPPAPRGAAEHAVVFGVGGESENRSHGNSGLLREAPAAAGPVVSDAVVRVRPGRQRDPADGSRRLDTPNPERLLSASKPAGTSGKQRDAPPCRRAAATRRAGPLRLQRRLRLQVGPERSFAVQAASSRFRDRPCSEHPERAFRAAVPYEFSAGRCGSGKVSVFSTAGPAAEPNVGGCRISRTACPGIGGGAPVHVNSGQEDRFHVPAVVPEPVPGAAAHLLEADGPCGDVVRSAGVAPVDGQLERPVQRFPVFPSTASVSPA